MKKSESERLAQRWLCVRQSWEEREREYRIALIKMHRQGTVGKWVNAFHQWVQDPSMPGVRKVRS
jgi:hypothetical protein